MTHRCNTNNVVTTKADVSTSFLGVGIGLRRIDFEKETPRGWHLLTGMKVRDDLRNDRSQLRQELIKESSG